MRVDDLTLDGYRNYELQTAKFTQGVNVILGDNAQGKTNLLEAVYALCTGSAFRARTDKEAIRFGSDTARIQSRVFCEGRDQTIDILLRRAGRKTLTVNGAKVRTAAELSGKLRAVLFCPEDLNMIKDGPAVRRKLMDACMSQLRPRYIGLVSDYNRTLEQKSAIVRNWRERRELLDLLGEYNERLSILGAEIIRYRAQLIRALSPRAAEIHAEFSSGRETLALQYKTVSAVSDTFAGRSQIQKELLSHLESHRRAEMDSGQCLSGVHRDDVEVFVNAASARQYASQGQARTAALSVKLAQRELLREDCGEFPLLLLDDVLSELDSARRKFVLGRISGGQVLITCCSDADFEGTEVNNLIKVKAGVIS